MNPHTERGLHFSGLNFHAPHRSSGAPAQPVNSYSIFMARAWIMEDSGANLQDRLDISWLARGDMFYMHKLAETIKAWRRTP